MITYRGYQIVTGYVTEEGCYVATIQNEEVISTNATVGQAEAEIDHWIDGSSR